MLRIRSYLTYLWPPKILLAVVVHYEDVLRLHELFLNSRGRKVDVIAMLDRDAAASPCDPAKGIELAAEGADIVGRVLWVGGSDECVRVGAVCRRHAPRAAIVR